MSGKSRNAADWANQRTIFSEIGRIERRVMGERPSDESIDNLGRQSEEIFVEWLEVAICVGPLTELRPDVGAGRTPTRMKKDRFLRHRLLRPLTLTQEA
jgi:hypothetical protein